MNQPFNHLTNQVGEHIYVDHRPQDQMSLLDATNAACEDITADHYRGWVRHSRRFFPRCMAMETSDVLMKIFGLTNKSDRCPPRICFSWMLFSILCICGNIRNMKCTVIRQAIFHFTCNTLYKINVLYKYKCSNTFF